MKKIGLKVSQYVKTQAHGAEAHTLVKIYNFLNEKYQVDIIGCEVCPLNKNIFNYIKYLHLPKIVRKFLHIPVAIINTLLYTYKNKPDLLFAIGGVYYNGLAVLLAGKIFKTKVLVRTAEDHFNYYKYCENLKCKIKHYFINYLISKFVLKNADYVLVVGEKSKEHFISNGIDKNKIFAIPGPISDENFIVKKDKKEIRKKLNLPINKTIVLYVGAISGVKGTNELPNIIKEVLEKDDSFFFCIIGSEINGNKITKDILEVGKNNVILLPPKPHSELKLYYNCSDVLVFLTKTGVGYGQVTIEATKAQLPVIAYNSGLDCEWFFKDNCYKNINDIINNILNRNYKLLQIPEIFEDHYVKNKHNELIEKILKNTLGK